MLEIKGEMHRLAHWPSQQHTVMLQKCSAVAFWQQKTETYCSWTTKMQLSCEGKLETGCLQVTFRSLWLLKRGEKGAQFIRQNSDMRTIIKSHCSWMLDEISNGKCGSFWYIRWGLRTWWRENKSLRGLWWDNVKENLRSWGIQSTVETIGKKTIWY